MNIIIFLGAPGSGKGSQSDLIVDRLTYVKFSTGDLLREVSKEESSFGKELRSIMQSGALVSDEIVSNILEESLKKNLSKKIENFIFDGYPRTIDQAKNLDKIFQKFELKPNNIKIISLDIDEDIVIKRISGRFFCDDCKESYHDIFKPTKQKGICDVCGSRNLIRRADDNSKTVKNRIKNYNKEIEPIIDYYQSNYGLKKIIANQDFEDVYSDIKNYINI